MAADERKMAVNTTSPGAGGAAVLEKQEERVRKRSPRYKVLLHNDPVNSMEYVVMTLQQVVPQLSEQDAMAIASCSLNCGTTCWRVMTTYSMELTGSLCRSTL